MTSGSDVGPMDIMFGLDVVSMGSTSESDVRPMDTTSRRDCVSIGPTSKLDVRPMNFRPFSTFFFSLGSLYVFWAKFSAFSLIFFLFSPF